MERPDNTFKAIGLLFSSIGVIAIIIGIFVCTSTREIFPGTIGVIIGIIFSITGGVIIGGAIKNNARRKEILNNGIKYTGKIYEHIEDKSVMVNEGYLINIKVRYFDEDETEREAIIPTKFTQGSGAFPIGATIDIVRLGTEYTWVDNSVRFDKINREDELMDDNTVTHKKIIGITCKACGANFTTNKGYASKCPFCDTLTNHES